MSPMRNGLVKFGWLFSLSKMQRKKATKSTELIDGNKLHNIKKKFEFSAFKM